MVQNFNDFKHDVIANGNVHVLSFVNIMSVTYVSRLECSITI